MYKVMEDVLDGIMNFFKAEGKLNETLNEIEIARGVDIQRTDIIERYEVLDFDQIKIEILPDDTIQEYGNSSTAPLIGDHFNYNAVDIFITTTGTDTLDVNNVLLRYAEAIQKMVRKDETFNKRFNWVKIIRVDYSPMVRDQRSGALSKICTVSLQVRD